MLHPDYLRSESEATIEMLQSKDSEIVLSGPYQSGKTFPCLVKLHLLCCRYPLKALVVRAQQSDLSDTVIPEYHDKILPCHPQSKESFVKPYGGNKPEWYDYPNGARITLGGMDNAGKWLSGAYDLIFFNQCEQGKLADWEILATRCTGRSGRWKTKDGTVHHQVLGDANPDSHLHWIPKRSEDGLLKLVNSTHVDNPTLFINGEWTEQGEETIALLKRTLSGIRYQRGFLGKWVAAEGQVYGEFDADKHVINELPDISEWTKYRAIDFGLVHPFVCLWFARDPEDGTLILYREWRYTGKLVSDHAQKIKELFSR